MQKLEESFKAEITKLTSELTQARADLAQNISMSGDLTLTGSASFTTITDLGAVTTADINGGTIDGVTIGGASAGAGTFTTISIGSQSLFDTSTGPGRLLHLGCGCSPDALCCSSSQS